MRMRVRAGFMGVRDCVAVGMLMAVEMLVAVGMLMAVGMSMLMDIPRSFLRAADQHAYMGTGNPAFLRRLASHFDAGEPKAIHGAQKCFLVAVQLQKGRHQHIAGCTHIAFKINRFHLSAPPI